MGFRGIRLAGSMFGDQCCRNGQVACKVCRLGEGRGHCTLHGGEQGSRTDTVTLGAFVTWHLTSPLVLSTGGGSDLALNKLQLAAGSGRKVTHIHTYMH